MDREAAHQRQLAASGISAAIQQERGYRTIRDLDERRRVQFARLAAPFTVAKH